MESPKDGPWLVTLDGPSLIPFMTYYQKVIKEKNYIKKITKASSGTLNNQELIIEILNYIIIRIIVIKIM